MGDVAYTNTIKPVSGKSITVEGDLEITGTTSSPSLILPPGLIFPYAGGVAPDGYLLCDGRSLSRAEYANLFAVVGTTWGSDNPTSFKIPDLRGAFLRGAGSHGTEQMANGNYFAGGNVGDFEDDQTQGHIHNEQSTAGTDDTVVSTLGTGSTKNGASAGYSSAITSAQTETTTPVDDGTNGTPRTGDETRPFNASVNYIIKV